MFSAFTRAGSNGLPSTRSGKVARDPVKTGEMSSVDCTNTEEIPDPRYFGPGRIPRNVSVVPVSGAPMKVIRVPLVVLFTVLLYHWYCNVPEPPEAVTVKAVGVAF
jgi:hypothetical protein